MTRKLLRFVTLTLAIVCGFSTLHAQSVISQLRPVAQVSRIAPNADFGPQTQLSGHIPGWVSNGVATSQAVNLNAQMHLMVMLQRDPSVQAAFEQLLEEQQNPSSPYYHQWLTPQQIGTLFGPTQADVDTVTSWLTAQGLTVVSVSPSRISIQVTGTTAAVAAAFRTNFQYFNVGGTPRLSAASEPSIPTALLPVVSVIGGLVEIPIAPNSHRQVIPGQSLTPGATVHPDFNSSSGAHYMMPGDFSLIFDINSVYAGGNTGAKIGATTQRVAIVGQSRVTASDISTFLTDAGISSYTLNTIVATGGVDPGVTNDGNQDEATLDVDRVLSTAPGVTADLLVASAASGGIGLGLDYNVNTLLDPIETISFGGCEIQAGSAAVTQDDAFFQQAAMEGISTFVSSGDSGATGCQSAFSNPQTNTVSNPNATTLSTNFLCSSTAVTCVGGTEFNDSANPSTYWSSSQSSTGVSAIGYIPEAAWNEPTTTQTSSGYQPASSGGGVSLYIAKASWQTGTGVPATNFRYTPDVSFPAASHDGYLACLDYALSGGQSCAKGNFLVFSGTSAAAPGMAGVAALLNTKMGAAQGNINSLLYKLFNGSSSASVFHDVTVSSSGVTNCVVTTASMCDNSIPNTSGLTGTAGFTVNTGYDEVTGLGSIDVANFLTAASPTKVSTTLALTSVTPNPVALSNSVTLTATLTPSSTTPGAATGTVSFYYTPSGGTATLINSAVTINNNVASTSTSFSTAGTYTITAVYSGDTNYGTSTAAGVSLTVNPGPSFSVVPTTTTYNLVSGATTGNTDTITLTSTNSFVGTVVMSCNVTNSSGTAAGSCATTTPVTLTSGGTGSSTLTITTTPGTSGVLSVTVKGTSGTTIVTSSTITVNLTASSFTAGTGSAISVAAGSTTGTSSFTVTSVNGFAGTVTFTCAASNPSITNAGATTCTASSVTLTSGGTATSNVSLTSTLGSSGASTLTINGSGTTAGATIAATTSTTISATIAPPSFAESTPGSVTINPSGATTGNTTTSTVTSTAFTGTVNFTCTLTATSGSPANPATCAASAVTLASGGTGTTTITVASTTAHAGRSGPVQAGLTGWGIRGGAIIAMLVCLVRFRRRRFIRSLAAFVLLACGLVAVSGCGGGGGGTITKSSSDGTYTGTLTGSGTSTGAGAAFSTSATFSVTITN